MPFRKSVDNPVRTMSVSILMGTSLLCLTKDLLACNEQLVLVKKKKKQAYF